MGSMVCDSRGQVRCIVTKQNQVKKCIVFLVMRATTNTNSKIPKSYYQKPMKVHVVSSESFIFNLFFMVN